MKTFRTEPRDSEIYFEPKKKDASVYGATTTVYFNIDIEYREWGIKGLYVSLKAIGGSFILEHDDDDVDNEDYSYEYDGDKMTLLNENTSEITVFDNVTLETEGEIDSDTITINSVIVEFAKDKAIISIGI